MRDASADEDKAKENSMGVGRAATPKKKGEGGKGASSTPSASSAGTKRAAEADLEAEQKNAEQDAWMDAAEEGAADD